MVLRTIDARCAAGPTARPTTVIQRGAKLRIPRLVSSIRTCSARRVLMQSALGPSKPTAAKRHRHRRRQLRPVRARYRMVVVVVAAAVVAATQRVRRLVMGRLADSMAVRGRRRTAMVAGESSSGGKFVAPAGWLYDVCKQQINFVIEEDHSAASGFQLALVSIL